MLQNNTFHLLLQINHETLTDEIYVQNVYERSNRHVHNDKHDRV